MTVDPAEGRESPKSAGVSNTCRDALAALASTYPLILVIARSARTHMPRVALRAYRKAAFSPTIRPVVRRPGEGRAHSRTLSAADQRPRVSAQRRNLVHVKIAILDLTDPTRGNGVTPIRSATSRWVSPNRLRSSAR